MTLLPSLRSAASQARGAAPTLTGAARGQRRSLVAYGEALVLQGNGGGTIALTACVRCRL